MPSENARLAQRLLDIVNNIDIATDFVKGMSFAQCESDPRIFYATLHSSATFGSLRMDSYNFS